MKATGIVRKIDELGRIVIPKEIRKSQGWDNGTSMEIFMSDEGMVIRKYEANLENAELVNDLNAALAKTRDVATINAINKAIEKIRN